MGIFEGHDMTLDEWIKRNGVRQVPIERCLAIERATGGKVRAEEMRPDHDWSRPGKRRA